MAGEKADCIKILEQAQKDYLTGFFTRQELENFLLALIKESEASGKFFSLALFDLDRFKRFNDKFGHVFGDEILKYATSTLRLTFYESPCFLFRYGGDEFIAVFPEKEARAAFRLSRQCNYNLSRRPFLFRNKFYKITISCGISGFPQDGKAAEELIKKADQAMYFSKRCGRNLTTLAHRIVYLRLRNAFLVILSAMVILFSFVLFYRLSFKKIIQPTVRQIQNMKIITKPDKLDMVVLKNGMVFEGRILSEADNKVVLNLYMDKGEGTTTFNKSEIAEIKYATKGPRENK